MLPLVLFSFYIQTKIDKLKIFTVALKDANDNQYGTSKAENASLCEKLILFYHTVILFSFTNFVED